MTGATQIVLHIGADELGPFIDARLDAALCRYLRPVQPVKNDDALPALPTIKQVTRYFNISRATLNNWSKDTEERPALLVPIRVGRSVRYRREDVEAAMREHRRFAAG